VSIFENPKTLIEEFHSLKNFEGLTALHIAAKWGNVAIVRLLLLHGADKGCRDADEKTPLDLTRIARASWWGRQEHPARALDTVIDILTTWGV
jgi:Ankyrin repeats (many copies)